MDVLVLAVLLFDPHRLAQVQCSVHRLGMRSVSRTAGIQVAHTALFPSARLHIAMSANTGGLAENYGFV